MVCIALLTPIPGLSPPALSVQTGNLLAGDTIKRRVGDYERVIYLASSDCRPEDHRRVFADGASNEIM